MSFWGYCRISRKQQNIERQIRNIKQEYPEAVIVQEAYTGTKIDRPEWLKLYKKLKENDTVVFDSVSRMSRNADEGFALYEDLFNKGVNLVFLKEHHIDTDTYKKTIENNIGMTGTNVDYILEGINKYMFALAKEQIKIAFEQAEKEVEDLHQRTKEGLQTARLNGKQIGQRAGAKLTTKKSIEMKAKIIKMARDFEGNMSDKEVIETLKLARNTYYKYKREINNE
ncbi:MAG: recombinase family protein [Oscillospiraceae bacterium]|nr:recombinase family protein [Oscillospiraceae bacterium]